MPKAPHASLTLRAVAGQLERGVRPHRANSWETRPETLLKKGFRKEAVSRPMDSFISPKLDLGEQLNSSIAYFT